MIDDILEFNKKFVESKGYEKYITNKYPLFAKSFASKVVTVDFPTPPLPLIIPITFFIC